MSSTGSTPRTGATNEPTAIPLDRILRAGAAATAAALVANVVVWAIVAAVTDIPDDFMPLATVWATIVTTILFLALGVGVFALLVRFTREPIARFWQIAIAVLVLSFLNPILVARNQDGATTAGIITLEVMHVVAFLTFVPLFTALVRGK